jgi:predicted transcriptional regulator
MSNKSIRIEVSEELHTTLKLHAVKSRRKLKDIVVEAIEDYLKKQKVSVDNVEERSD